MKIGTKGHYCGHSKTTTTPASVTRVNERGEVDLALDNGHEAVNIIVVKKGDTAMLHPWFQAGGQATTPDQEPQEAADDSPTADSDS